MTVAALITRLQEIAIQHDASEVEVRLRDPEFGDYDSVETVELREASVRDFPRNAPPARCVLVVISA